MSGSSGPQFPGHLVTTRMMARSWWVFILRGIVAVLFGIAAFLLPGLGLVVILAFLAAWLAIDGAATLYQAATGGRGLPDTPKVSRAWLWIDGIVSLIAAAVLLFMPGLSALTLVLIVGIWSVIAGVARIVLAFQMKDVLVGLLGAVTIAIGVWLILRPGPGLLALIWLVAIEAVVIGVLMIAFGFRLRRTAHHPHGSDTAPPTPA